MHEGVLGWAQVSTCRFPQGRGDPGQSGSSGVLHTRADSVGISSRVSTSSRSLTDPQGNLPCAGKRLGGGCGPTPLTPGRGARISKTASNSATARRGQQVPLPPPVSAEAAPAAANRGALASFPVSEFLKQKLHPAAASSLPLNLPTHQTPVPRDATSASATRSPRSGTGGDPGVRASSSTCGAPTPLPGLGTGPYLQVPAPKRSV